MNSRRRFVRDSSVIAAVLMARPFDALAGNLSPLSTGGPNNRLVFLHTAGLNSFKHADTINYLARQKKNIQNAILLNAGRTEDKNENGLPFDAVNNPNHDFAIVKMGSGFKVGVINSNPETQNVIETSDEIAFRLKQHHDCHIVVCLSQLGYKQKNAPDDIKLATNSKSIDIVIGGVKENHSHYPVIAHNQCQSEVIIHSSLSNETGFGRIEIGFNRENERNYFSVTKDLP